MNKSIFILVLLLFFSCTQTKKHAEKNDCDCSIDSITALYFNYSFFGIKAIKCDSLTESYIPDFVDNDTGILNASITNCNVLKELEREISLLSVDTLQYPLDTRISLEVFYKDGSIEKICIDDMTPNGLFIDGIKQRVNNRLLFLIKNNIGYYSWFEPSENLDDEIKDTTFIKEPIIESPYYKKYEEMQKKK